MGFQIVGILLKYKLMSTFFFFFLKILPLQTKPNPDSFLHKLFFWIYQASPKPSGACTPERPRSSLLCPQGYAQAEKGGLYITFLCVQESFTSALWGLRVCIVLYVCTIHKLHITTLRRLRDRWCQKLTWYHSSLMGTKTTPYSWCAA